MKAPPRQLTLAETLKAVEWSKQHQKEWSQLTRSKLRDACFADTGVILSDRKIQEIEEILGIERRTKSADKCRQVNQHIASELTKVMMQLGITPSDDLIHIASGKGLLCTCAK